MFVMRYSFLCEVTANCEDAISDKLKSDAVTSQLVAPDFDCGTRCELPAGKDIFVLHSLMRPGKLILYRRVHSHSKLYCLFVRQHE